MRNVLVQASSRSWQGWPDFCTNKIGAKPCVQYTVDKFLAFNEDVHVTLIAPAFDCSGSFPEIFAGYPKNRFSLTFSHNDSPLRRMAQATSALSPDDYFIRVDGLHFASLIGEAMDMLEAACDVDCIKFPDDFPAQLSAEVYRVGAVRDLLKMALEPVFHVHPKHAFQKFSSLFTVSRISQPTVHNDYLSWARTVAETVYVARLGSNANAYKVGDLHSFHYDLVYQHLEPDQLVLDCSSGTGEGTKTLALSGATIIGGDIDLKQVNIARKQFGANLNITFEVVDITNQPFEDEYFDSVVCLETIEHVDDRKCCKEIWRVLKPGGLAVISTPQNSHGHIPINPMHEREYSLSQLVHLLEKYFIIEDIIAIKQGRVVIENDYCGNSMMLFCRKG